MASMKRTVATRSRNRRTLPALIALSGVIGLTSFAQPAATTASRREPDKVDLAVARGVGYLVSRQESNGSFVDRDMGERDRHETALTSLGVLALLASGHLPTDRTKEGAAVKRAIDFLLLPDRQDADGYYGNRDSSRMYGHGITALALTELLGMGADKAQDRLIRERARRAVELILRSQQVKKREVKFNGGWRYTPESPDADLSVTVWQLMALRSGKNAGLDVPKSAIDGAVAYLKRSYSGDDARGRRAGDSSTGGFAYQPGSRPEFAMAASGLLALVVCGEYDAPEVRGAALWLRAHPPEPDSRWFYYGIYYYAQGMFQAGGEFAEEGRRKVHDVLLPRQDADGSWAGTQGQELGVGRIYSTSLALLSLAVRYHYLPIYQR
jgi:hypothetical protein